MHPCEKPCWHDTGVVKLSYPAQVEMVCCNCGVQSTRDQTPVEDLSAHGKFHPKKSQ